MIVSPSPAGEPTTSGGLFGASATLLERLCADVGRQLPPHAAHGLLLLEGVLRGVSVHALYHRVTRCGYASGGRASSP